MASNVYSGETAAIYLCNAGAATAVTMTTEALVDVSTYYGATARTMYSLSATGSPAPRHTKKFWDATATWTVFDNAAAMNSSLYTIQHLGGIITFNPAITSGHNITVTGKYLPFAQVAMAREWSLQVNRNVLDASVLGGNGWKASFPSFKSGTISFSQIYNTDAAFRDYFGDAASGDNTYAGLGLKLLVVLWVAYNSTTGNGLGYACYARANQAQLRAAVSDLENEQLSLEVDGKVYGINIG